MNENEFILFIVFMSLSAVGIIITILLKFKTNGFTELSAWIFGKTTVELYDGANKKKLVNVTTLTPGVLDHKKLGPSIITKQSHIYDQGTGAIRYQAFAEHIATVPVWINAVFDKIKRKYGNKYTVDDYLQVLKNNPDAVVNVGQRVTFKLNDLKDYLAGTMTGAAVKRAIHHKVHQQLKMQEKNPYTWVYIGIGLFMALLGVGALMIMTDSDSNVTCVFPTNQLNGTQGQVVTVHQVDKGVSMGDGISTAFDVITPDGDDSGSKTSSGG